jgi:P-type conjugative transfer protein TrbJ
MRLRFLRSTAAAITIAAALPVVVPIPAQAQWAVIDVANLAQNVLIAARALQEVNNQIQSLQNEATMLENMARNLSSLNTSQLGGITNDLQQISTLMNQAQGISFNVQSVEAAFQQLYPQSFGTGTSIPQLLTDAQSRWQNARGAFQQTMQVQSQIAQAVQSDTVKLASLVNTSQGAQGNLQVSQATNQLLALSIKQQLQMQTLMAAQGRAEALQGANEAEAEQEGRAALQSFLGSSSAYTPQ